MEVTSAESRPLTSDVLSWDVLSASVTATTASSDEEVESSRTFSKEGGAAGEGRFYRVLPGRVELGHLYD